MMYKKALFSTCLLAVWLVLEPQGASAQWGSKADMYSEDGVQVGVDSRVFSVLTMLNQHGFNAEKYLGPEPLKQPQYSETRVRIRKLMRRLGPVQKKFRGFIDKTPKAFDWYVSQALIAGKAPGFETTMSDDAEVRAIAEYLHNWYHEEGGSGFYDIAVKMEKARQGALVDAINTMTATIQNTIIMGDTEDALLEEELNPLGRVVVIIAPMAPHGWLERIETPDVTYVVTGPWKEEGHVQKVANVVAVAFARTLVGGQVQAQPEKLEAFKKLHAQWSGERQKPETALFLAAEIIACASYQHATESEVCPLSVALEDPQGAKTTNKIKKKLTKLVKEKALFKDILPEIL